jgi:CRP-like cAMP-binding protein
MKNFQSLMLTADIERAMQQCALIAPLVPDYNEHIKKMTKVFRVPETQYLFSQGDELTAIYLVISGSIKLHRIAQSGQEKVLEIVGPGQTFAEALLFSGMDAYPVSALALEESVLVAISAKQYVSLFNDSNKLCMTMLGALSRRLHWMVNEVDRLTLHNATYRLVDYMLNQIEENSEGLFDVKLTAPKNVIASRLSIKPETFSRTLRKLASENLIRLDNGNIVLLDIDKLRQLIALD